MPGAGSLELNGVAVNANDVIAVASIRAASSSPPDPDENGSGYASFTFSVKDSAGTFDGTPNTLTLDVTPVNDLPAGTDNTVTTDEDTGYTFSASDFGFTDVDTGDTLAAVRIDTLPGAGALTPRRQPGRRRRCRRRRPTSASWSSPPRRRRERQRLRELHLLGQGQRRHLRRGTANTLTLDVTPVNDLPAGTDNTVTTDEDTGYTFSASDFGFTDVDTGDTLAPRSASTPCRARARP